MHRHPHILRRCAAEMFGTFCLVFAGTGAVIANDLSGGAVTHLGVSLTFGLMVLAMIHAIGDVSGAHLNPAVTLAFAVARRFPGMLTAPYVFSQFTGALVASGLLRLMFPTHTTLGMTLPAGSESQSWFLEMALAAILMFVILGVSSGAKERGITAGIAVGAVIALEALFAGPVCGASMNPARSLAPALWAWHFEHLWIYLTAPVWGALLAVPLCIGIRGRRCCPVETPAPSAS